VGWALWGVGVVPVFSEKPQQPDRTFFVIASSRPALFFESSATAPDFFYNPQQSIQTFFVIVSSRPALFFESSTTAPDFFTIISNRSENFLRNSQTLNTKSLKKNNGRDRTGMSPPGKILRVRVNPGRKKP
jgi:hypothetical protein